MIALIAFTRRGCLLGKRVAEALGGTLSVPRRFSQEFHAPAYDSLGNWTAAQFARQEVEALVFVSAAGIAVRAVAPYVRDKFTDPAVVSVDEGGRYAIPLLSGHMGGANRLAREVAEITGGEPVISTATDVNGVFPVDLWAKENGLVILERKRAKEISAALLEGGPVGFASRYPWRGELPRGVTTEVEELGFCVCDTPEENPFPRTLHLLPQNLVLGLGCKRGTAAEQLEERLLPLLKEAGIDSRRIAQAGTIDLKRDEEGLLAFCRSHRWPVTFFSAAELAEAEGEFPPSRFVQSVTGVDNVCQRAAALLGDRVVLPKRAAAGITLAVAEREFTVQF